jgi:hypothetical protein
MFVGHALLAFSVVAGAAGLAGADRSRALALGLAAGAFASVPDVDMAYALVGVAGAGTAAPLSLTAAFWETGNAVHRAVTHSLLVAPLAALAAAGWAGGRRARVASLGLCLALVAAALHVSGPLAAAVMGLFGAALVGVAALLARRTDLGGTDVLGAALVGLATHPFGDLFTGTPPALLYPLDAVLVSERIALAADPTLHLLAAFGLELATAWLAVLVVAGLSGARVVPARRATAGVGYAAAFPLLPAPTLDLSYPFVFGALGVGLCVALSLAVRGRTAVEGRSGALSLAGPGRTAVAPVAARVALTALAAVTLAWAAYAAAYVAL